MSVGFPTGTGPRTCRTTVGGGSFCARISASACFLTEVAPPDVPHPVRVGVLERPLRQLRQQPLDPVADPAEHGVRERDGALEPRAADELHRFVHRGVPGHAAEEAELVGAQPERREHGGIELPHGPLAERLDRVVERPRPLNRPEGELPRE